MKNLLKTALMGAAVLTMAGPVLAQTSQLADDGRLVRSVNLADLKALVESEGHTVTNATMNEGAPVIIATDVDSGLTFGLLGTACDGTQTEDAKCNGINMLATWAATPENSDPAFINELNYSKAAVSVWTGGDSVGVSRYLILDGGQTMENLKMNLGVFLALIGELSPNF